MLFNALQTTLAFAPAPEDLDDVYFDSPVVAFAEQQRDDEDSQPAQP